MKEGWERNLKGRKKGRKKVLNEKLRERIGGDWKLIKKFKSNDDGYEVLICSWR